MNKFIVELGETPTTKQVFDVLYQIFDQGLDPKLFHEVASKYKVVGLCSFRAEATFEIYCTHVVRGGGMDVDKLKKYGFVMSDSHRYFDYKPHSITESYFGDGYSDAIVENILFKHQSLNEAFESVVSSIYQ